MKVNKPNKIRLKTTINYSTSEGIVVFIEKIFRYRDEIDNSLSYYLLMDFPFDNSHKEAFFSSIERNVVIGKSMLEIRKIKFQSGGVPREGRFYFLPTNFIDREWEVVQDSGESGSNFIALTRNGSMQNVAFNNALNPALIVQEMRNVPNNVWVQNVEKKLNLLGNKVINVDVYDVGQGNWNEILFDNNNLIVYDFGSNSGSDLVDSLATRIIPARRNIRIDSILNPSKKFSKTLIISHWDIDHYNGLITLPDSIIRDFDFCIVPNKIENRTTFEVLQKLLNLVAVYPIEMNSKGRGRGATSVLTPLYTSDLFTIYRGTKCSDRNKRGLSLSLHVKDIDFIFPADHHYNQITQHIIPNCARARLNIVVPHHGGHAGNHNVTRSWIGGEECIMSTNGRYGHPFAHIISAMGAAFRTTHRTDSSGDYSRIL